ncbi:MAG: hypothetical protein CM15mP107_4870 [Bacteroidota bacterium]|nr:MAG: hypothetical protein CM15mP107_4870 [Bacteroidota bacterium]
MAEWDGHHGSGGKCSLVYGRDKGQPAGVMGCLALLSNPDMSEEKGMAFTDMLEEFFTPKIVAALDLKPLKDTWE